MSPTQDQIKSYAAAIASQFKQLHDEKALHFYRCKNGNPLYWRVRVKCLATGEKFIRPFYWDGNKFINGEPPIPHEGKPLYGLELLSSKPAALVVIVEGEKCADLINKQAGNIPAIIAMTSGGATSAGAANWLPLKGRNVVIFPDNDVPGANYAADVSAALSGIASSVCILDIAPLNLFEKGDAVDYFASGGTLANLVDLIANQAMNNQLNQGVIEPPDPLPSLPAVLPFDYDYLPDCLRGLVRDISERMQCPPDFAAVAAYVMLATIIGRKVGIRPKRQDNWTVIPNLWGAVVGNSGVMKSPTLSAVLSPINRLQRAANEAFNKATTDREQSAVVNKMLDAVQKSEAKKQLKKDKNADVKKLLQPDFVDEKPILKRYFTNNASYEALGELLIENPNGLLVESDEIVGLLKQLDASGQELARSFYLTAADGDKSYTFDRIMRGKGLHIEAVCLSILGGIQPGVLAEYVRQATSNGAGADGLLQRFGLMVYPDISPDWHDVDRYPDKAQRERVDALIDKLDNLETFNFETDNFGGVPFVRFDETAQEIFSEWRASLELRLRSGDEHHAIVSHLSKYRKLIPSLALINHLCDSDSSAVNEASLLRAIAFSEYLESHAMRIYSYATRPEIDTAKALLQRITSGKLANPFTARDVYRAGWAGLENSSKVQSAINMLLDYRHLVEMEVSTGGRPTAQYHWVKAGVA